jgi:hypothetical protein
MFCIALLTVTSGLSHAQADRASEQQMFTLLNQERTNRGLQPLVSDDRLVEAARQHTALMVQHKALSHQFDDEPRLQLRFANQELPSDQQGENVGFAKDALASHEGFMHSPEHRENILHPAYNAVGIGVIRSGDGIYVTEDFAHRIKEYSEPAAESASQKAIADYAASRRTQPPVRQPLTQLRSMACDMARNDALNTKTPSAVPGVEEVFVWTTSDPESLPKGVKDILTRQVSSGYALGACFAPSVSRPGGVYWVVMVFR